ncbi:MAG: PPC domain-containing protein, partial [Candidatus Neomarinimicrobiota bacterium]|nr:PPC domain-containing protein [Candidatus Neomarinimicrobiota bacterium]
MNKQTSMENIMMINGIFNKFRITSNWSFMACKMLCMCFIISTVAFAQGSSGGRSVPLDPNWTPLSHEEKMLLIEQSTPTINSGNIMSNSTRQGGDTFADAVAITFPYNGSGTTVGYQNDYGPFDDPTNLLCWPDYSESWGLASDVVYKLTLLEPMNIVVNLDGSNYDTALGVYDSSNTALVLANDDYNGLQSYVQCDLAPGTYYIVVDGYMTDEGDYEIAVYEHFPIEEFAYIEVSEEEAAPG